MDTTELDSAKAYEELYVPALFDRWARVVADEALLKPGERVLDVACGTGALARVVAERVAPGQAIGLDPHEGMLSIAAQISPEIQWQKGSAEALPFPDHAFDGVVSQFGLMYFSDPMKGIQEMIRVLAPGGRLVIAVWDVIEHSPMFALVDEIYLNHLGEGAREALRAPFIFGELPHFSSPISASCGYPSRIITRQVIARFSSADAMVRADLEGWMPRANIGLKPDQVGDILSECRCALSPLTTPKGTLEGVVSAHIAQINV